VRRSASLVAISRATADALAARFPRAAGHTTVALLGPTPAAGLEAGEEERLPAPGFVLAVGTLEPRKNLPRLVAAYGELDERLTAGHPLVVVGPPGWEMGETLAALESLGDHCVRLGYVSDGMLAELYRRCAVFCYPSLGEGFGLPVLEAMAEGAAVVTSQISSLPEVGGDAVEYVDPASVASIAAGLQRVLGDPAHRAELGTRARARAAEFSWEGFASIVLDALDAAATDAGRTAGGAADPA
jgi:glycosyltransferase involved in cell wall biosynthesis